jgi:hypothetical protein
LISLVYTLSFLSLKKFDNKGYWYLIFAIPIIGLTNIDAIYILLPLIISLIIFKSLINNQKISIYYVFLATLSLALISFTKGSIFYLSFIDLFLICLLVIYFKQYKYFYIIIITYPISLLFFWILAGQNISNLPSFMYYIYYMSMSYSITMASYVNIYNDFVFAVVLLFLIYILFRELNLKFKYKMFSIILLLPTLFILFKEGFVRDDVGHMSIAYSKLISLALIFPLVYSFKSFNIIFLSIFIILFSMFNQYFLYINHGVFP